MPIRTLFALLFLFSAPSWSGTPEQPEVLSNAAPPSIAARMPAKATLIKRAGHAPLLAKTAKGEDIVFEYLPDGRLHAIRAPWREKVIVYGEVGQAPIAVEDNLKNGEVRTDQKLIQNPALLAAIQDINSSGGKLLLDSMLGQPGRLMATLSPTFRSSVKQFVAKNTDYDSGIGTQPFLLCEIPPVCALCLAACHLLAEDARLTCEPLQGDDRWNCFINAGRDELTCGLICL